MQYFFLCAVEYKESKTVKGAIFEFIMVVKCKSTV